MSDIDIGKILAGRYKVLARLGTGGMGSVYKIEDLKQGGIKALKLLSRELNTRKDRERFVREFLRLSKLEHPNIVRVHEQDWADDVSPFYTMEFIEGKNLLDAWALMESERACSVVADILQGLMFIHSRGIVHLDVKPSNIFVIDAGPRPTAKLADFGLARLFREKGSGKVSGTPGFVAPELLEGKGADGRCDLYSFGVTICHAASGGKIEFDENREVVFRAGLFSRMPQGFEKVISRLLERDPRKRYQFADEVLRDFSQFLGRTYVATGKGTVFLPAFTGRQKLIREFDSLLLDQTQNNRAVLLVRGESGTGKTRLLEEFAATASMKGFFPIMIDYPGKNRGLEIFHQFCEKSFERTGDEFFLEARSRFSAWAGSSEREFFLQVDEFLCKAAEILFRKPGTKPHLVVLVDSAHLIDELSFAYISMFSNNSSLAGGLFVLTCLDPPPVHSFLEEDELSKASGFQRRELDPLSRDEIELVVASMLGTATPPSGLAQRVFEISQGNPLYAVQFVKMAVEGKILSRAGGAWKYDEEGKELPLPGSLEAAFENILSGLGTETLSVLKAASVFEISILGDFLEELVSLKPEGFLDSLGELLGKGLLSEQGDGLFFFSNSSLQQYVERRLEPGRKKELHEHLAGILEEKSDADETVWEIADHYLKSNRLDKAKEYARKAAGLALRRRCPRKGAHFLKTLLELHPEVSEEEKNELMIQLADLLEEAGMLDQALGALKSLEAKEGDASPFALKAIFREGVILRKKGELRQAREKLDACHIRAVEQGQESVCGEILLELGWLEHLEGRGGEAVSTFETAREIFDGLQDSKNVALALMRKGIVEIYSGMFDGAEASFSEALSIGRKEDDILTIQKCLLNIGFVLDNKGELEKGLATYKDALSLSEGREDSFSAALILNNVASVEEKLGRFEEAEKCYLQVIDLRNRIGNKSGEAWSRVSLSWVLMLRGEWLKAEEYITQGLEMSCRLGDRSTLSAAKENLALLSLRKGDIGQAEKLLLESRELKDALGLKARSLVTSANLAFLAIEKEEAAKAEALLRSVLDEKKEFVEPSFRVRLLSCLAYTLCLRNESKDAAGYVSKSLDLLPRYENKVDVSSSKRILGQSLCILGDGEKGLSLIEQAIAEFREMGAPYEEAESLLAKGGILADDAGKQGERAEPLKSLKGAIKIFRRLGAKRKLEETLGLYAAVLESALSRTGKEARREADTLALREMLELANSIEKTEKLLGKVMELALRKTGGERGLIALFSKRTGRLEVVVNSGVEMGLVRDALRISRSVLEDVAEKGIPLISRNAAEDERLRERKSVVDYQIHSLMCIPLVIKSEKVGAIYIDKREDLSPFAEDDLSFLQAFGHLAGVIIETSRLRSDLEEARDSLSRENESLRIEVVSRYRYENLVGQSEAIRKVFSFIEKVAGSTAPVLITGESGTGKELIAKTIHFTGPRAGKPFRGVNCAAIPRELIESELLGIEEKVATGVSMRKGLFEETEGGTVLLDEIGDMDPSVQAKVLRVLQDGEVRRVGGRKDIKVDVRTIVATNKDLRNEIKEGRFREDLYFRISTLPIEVPPLRERTEDIPLLADFFVKNYYKSLGMRPKPLPQEFIQALVKGRWSGNVRQLFNCLERTLVMSEGSEISFDYLPDEVREGSGPALAAFAPGEETLMEVISKVELEMLKRALEESSWNRTKAAKILGIPEPTIRYKMKKYGLTPPRKN
ncbi:MAG: sigma 54-interacting transcriptional regulator [Candidatus Eisenbacteria bacterium]|nr:sigma 54-interacting transcriptional regulator [Candidatus Eisenbacteria bacterium]